MQIQFITTPEDLQDAISSAVNKAFLTISLNAGRSPERKEIIDTKELCTRLNITEPTVIRWRKKGRIPFLQIGSSIRFDFGAVVSALEGGKKKGTKTI